MMSFRHYSARIKAAIRMMHDYEPEDTSHDSEPAIAINSPTEALSDYLGYHGYGCTGSFMLGIIEEAFGKPYAYSLEGVQVAYGASSLVTGVVFAPDDETAKAFAVEKFSKLKWHGYFQLTVTPIDPGTGYQQVINRSDI